MSTRWLLKEKYPKEFADKFPAYSGIILQLLYDRGLETQEKIDEFLNPDYSQDIHDPFLFKDMAKAVEIIFESIKNQEKILIYGDYDADGVTAVVLLEKTLKKIIEMEKNTYFTKQQAGSRQSLEPTISVFIPHRETDGYGINETNAREFIKQKFNLVITVDCGITNLEPIKILKNAGLKVIITDHHLAAEKLPAADAVLNCSLVAENYPFKKLAGVGVAFKLAQALLHKSTKNTKTQKISINNHEAFEKWLLDLVAIGTIGDMSPILGENRTLVKYGLMVLNKTPRLGFQELIRVSSLSNGEELKDLPLGSVLYDLDVRNISFQLVPRINAAGRMDHANIAYKLLTTENELDAIALARDIQEKNLARQKKAEEMFLAAKEIFGAVNDQQKILITFKEDWPVGLLGLVASKLKDEYCRPVILLTKSGETMSGSGRSIPEFNITLALQECAEFLDRYGGHSGACGLGIKGEENYQKFIKKITALAEEKLKDVALIPTLEIDLEANLKDLDRPLLDELKAFEPFAEANPLPLFWVKNLRVEKKETVGKDAKHLRFYFSENGLTRKAISFGTASEWGSQIKVGDIIDAVVELGVNEWNGNRELQLKVVDLKHANNDPNL